MVKAAFWAGVASPLTSSETVPRPRLAAQNCLPSAVKLPLWAARPTSVVLLPTRWSPRAIVPSVLLVEGAITETVLDDWSAVYRQSRPEIGTGR
ncbi:MULTISPECIES: hypothetical protein [unclassified Streptomyces]|uniref:hypothetical protein n=1 Tax=unclassified Streptomyces TaxID=2593676 RepID=UPI00131CADED|nr:hypothetical protein [Streptomyces sp. NRRL S-15]